MRKDQENTKDHIRSRTFLLAMATIISRIYIHHKVKFVSKLEANVM